MRLNLSSENAFNLDKVEFLSSGKGLSVESTFNSLPNDNILDWSKLKAYSRENINLTEKLKFAFERVHKTLWEKEKNAVYQHFFFLFLQRFQNDSFSGLLKVGIMW